MVIQYILDVTASIFINILTQKGVPKYCNNGNFCNASKNYQQKLPDPFFGP